jgi:hypothetical protein
MAKTVAFNGNVLFFYPDADKALAYSLLHTESEEPSPYQIGPEHISKHGHDLTAGLDPA